MRFCTTFEGLVKYKWTSCQSAALSRAEISFRQSNVLFTNEFRRRQFMIQLRFSFQLPSKQVSICWALKHAHVSRENDPRGLLHVFILRQVAGKIMQHLFISTLGAKPNLVLITVQLPCNYIWKNNFSSHFRAYLWKDFFALFSDNLSEKFTSCLIKASEIRASSNKKTFAASMKWKYLLWYANPKMKHHTIISQSHSSTTTTAATTTTTTSLIKNAWQELTSKHSGVEANKNV